jgi:hypothetical protein
VLGFGFDEVNQSSSSGPDPLFSDPLHFRVESKCLIQGILAFILDTIFTSAAPLEMRILSKGPTSL